jgi:hypothetical protein
VSIALALNLGAFIQITGLVFNGIPGWMTAMGI